MSRAILTVQIAGDGSKNKKGVPRYEKFLRIETTDTTADGLRKAITQMMRKPSDYDLSGKHYKSHANDRPKKAPPVIREDDERVKELQA